jgi:hypothetical protein
MGMEAIGTTALTATIADSMPRRVMNVGQPGRAMVLRREAVSAEATEVSAATCAIGVRGWGPIHPALPGDCRWSDNSWVGADVRTRGLELICRADGSGIVRFKLIQQSLVAEGGTGCEQDDF